MTDLESKEIHIYTTRNRLIRDSIKEQIWEKGDWDVDIVMEALGLEPDTKFGKAVEAYVKKHGEIIAESITEEVFHEKREAAIEESEEHRLIASHQPTVN